MYNQTKRRRLVNEPTETRIRAHDKWWPVLGWVTTLEDCLCLRPAFNYWHVTQAR